MLNMLYKPIIFDLSSNEIVLSAYLYAYACVTEVSEKEVKYILSVTDMLLGTHLVP